MSFRTRFNSVIDPLITGVIADDAVLFTPGNSFPNRSDKTVGLHGIFDRAYFESNGMESSSPIFKGDTIDLADAKHTNGNSMIEYNGNKFRVVGVESDGTGKTMLKLQAAS